MAHIRKPFPRKLRPHPRSAEAEALSKALYDLSRCIRAFVQALRVVS